MGFIENHPRLQALREYAASRKVYIKALRSKAKYSNIEAVGRQYERVFGRRPDLDNPGLFTEKIQWLKLFHSDPLYPICSDKYAVREYVGRKGHADILNELIGVYDRAEQIDFEGLPERFVIKATHGCGWNYLCRDKEAERKLWPLRRRMFDEWLRQDFSLYSRELQYSHIRPRLICERYLENGDGSEIQDYKFFCFDGEPKLIQVDYDRHSGHTRNYYDPDWNLTDFRWVKRRNNPRGEPRPANLDRMLEVARSLSADFCHARVDLYNVDGRIYFGELTLTDGSGYVKLLPEDADRRMGRWMTLPDGKK